MIFKLIYKYLNNEASEEEMTTVFKWIEASEENKKQFIAIKKLWSITAIDDRHKMAVWKNVQKEISKNKKGNRFNLLKYAAVLVIFIGLGKLIFFSNNAEPATSNKVILELENGDINYITETQDKNLLNTEGKVIAEQRTNEIVYQPKTTTKNIAYHTLKVPYGKTFKVTLSDGSIVHLNSGTTFKYPEQFDAESNRKVYLIGEAFFEVAEDKLHPFIVHSNKVDVEVLGTKFNISDYPDDASHTVLVEGLVKISENSDKSNSTLLAPNYKATWNEVSKAFDLENINTNIYTSWVKGELILKDTPFSVISKKIERAYDVKIINNNTFLSNQKFTGSVKIEEYDIEGVLDLFRLDTPFEYTKSKKTIEIIKPNI